MSFDTAITAVTGAPLRRSSVRTLQVNLTARCNLACHHCHVESSPRRTEGIDARVASRLRTGVPQFSIAVEPARVRALGSAEPEPLDTLRGLEIGVFSAIARPDRLADPDPGVQPVVLVSIRLRARREPRVQPISRYSTASCSTRSWERCSSRW